MTTVLLVEDEANSITLARRAFHRANVPQPKVVNDGEAAIAYLNGDADYGNRDQFPLPALILLDLDLPKKNGFEVLEWLRAQSPAAIKHIPVVVLTTQQTPDEMKRAYDLGASLYLVKPLTAKSLEDSIGRLVFTFDPPQRIMICDDDPDHRAFVERELRREFPQAHIDHVTDMESFVSALNLGPFDLVITELQMKSLNGLTVLRTVKAHWAFCAVITLTSHRGEEIAVEAMKAGLDDYVLKSPEHFIHFNNAVRTALSRASVRRAKLRAEEKYRALVEQVPAITYTAAITLKSGTIYVSPQIECTGYSQEEWIANPDLWLDRIHPDDRERTLEAIHRTFTNHELFRVEYRLIARDGRELWIRDEGQVILDANGRPLHLQGVMLDITERKQAEESLRRSEEQYRLLLSNIDEIVYQLSATENNLTHATVDFVSAQVERIIGYTPQEFMSDASLWLNAVHPDDIPQVYASTQRLNTTQEGVLREYRLRHKYSGEYHWMEDRLLPQFDPDGKLIGAFGVARDVTERKQADSLLRQSEERYRTLAEAAHDMIFIIDGEGQIEYVNRSAAEQFKAQPEQVIGKSMGQVFPPTVAERQLGAIQKVIETGEPFYAETKSTFPFGEAWLSTSLVPLRNDTGNVRAVLGISRDITERKRADEEIERRADQFAALYEMARDLASEQDSDALLTIIVERARTLLQAKRGGLYLYDDSTQELIATIEQNTKVEIGTRIKLGEGLAGKVAQTRQPMIVDNYQTWEGRSPQYEGLPIGAVVQAPMIYGGELIGVLLVEETSESKRTFNEEDARLLSLFAAQAASAVRNARLLEETKRRADEFLALYEVTRDISAQQENLGSLLQSIVDRAVELLQAYSGMLYLYDPATQDLELTVERNSWGQVGMHLKLGEGLAGHVAQTLEPMRVDNYQAWEGRSPQLHGLPIGAVLGAPLLYGGEFIGALAIAEIAGKTNRKFTEADSRLLTLFAAHVASALRNAHSHNEMRRRVDELTSISRVSSALRYALTPSEIMPIVLDQIIELMKVDGALIALRDPHSGDTTIPLGRGKAAAPFVGTRLKAGEGVVGHVITTQYPYFSNDAHNDPYFLLSHLLGDTNAFACVPLIAQNETIGALWIGRVAYISDEDMRVLMSIADSTAGALYRAKLGVQTEQHLRRLESLHTIDVTISSTFDLRLTLNIVLEHVVAQLGVDAADVLLVNPATQTLSYFAGHGFRSNITQGMQIKMGTGFAGRAAISRSMVVINDLKTAQKDVIVNDPRNFNAEGFVTYYGVPLLAKGEIKGVLEVFHRAPLAPEAAWLDFLEALSTQTTIAIDNIQLFDNLQRTNANLNLSYDETLESWARISDQRAHRDEGYTRRAADLTLQLAQTLSIKDVELADLRRGALLYDIGSILIPDHILLKTNSLTAEELGMIRQHPEHSRRMLSTIRQLQRALDIPYHHHERWDGSGYPLGLKGEEIPLAARIFAVVDVWMALQSARPYRAAWSNEKACHYLSSMAGVQFDPRVVEVFLMTDAEINL